eukprot:scaffold7344_cov242-Pinguiococcus_pyrenoidosus.AAC.8
MRVQLRLWKHVGGHVSDLAAAHERLVHDSWVHRSLRARQATQAHPPGGSAGALESDEGTRVALWAYFWFFLVFVSITIGSVHTTGIVNERTEAQQAELRQKLLDMRDRVEEMEKENQSFKDVLNVSNPVGAGEAKALSRFGRTGASQTFALLTLPRSFSTILRISIASYVLELRGPGVHSIRCVRVEEEDDGLRVQQRHTSPE